MLLGLAVAAGFSTLSSGIEQLAAWPLVVGALLLFLKDFYNWSAKVDDEFQARGIGLGLGFLMGPLHTAGVVLLLIGCVQAL